MKQKIYKIFLFVIIIFFITIPNEANAVAVAQGTYNEAWENEEVTIDQLPEILGGVNDLARAASYGDEAAATELWHRMTLMNNYQEKYLWFGENLKDIPAVVNVNNGFAYFNPARRSGGMGFYLRRDASPDGRDYLNMWKNIGNEWTPIITDAYNRYFGGTSSSYGLFGCDQYSSTRALIQLGTESELYPLGHRIYRTSWWNDNYPNGDAGDIKLYHNMEDILADGYYSNFYTYIGTRGHAVYYEAVVANEEDSGYAYINNAGYANGKYHYEGIYRTTSSSSWKYGNMPTEDYYVITGGEFINISAELDDKDLGGILLEPIINFVNVIIDSIQSLTTISMTNDIGWRDVLVAKKLYSDYSEVGEDNGVRIILNDIGDEDTSRHIIWYEDNNGNNQYDINEDKIILDLQASSEQTEVGWKDSLIDGEEAINRNEAYTSSTGLIIGADLVDDDESIGNNEFFINATGFEDEYRYPQIVYSPEEIFSGDIELINANFFDAENINEDSAFYIIRNVVMFWFRILRYLGLAGLLSILIYTGIKIITSATSQEKAKYKERVVNWVIALFIMLLLPYVMSLISNGVSRVVDLFNTENLNNNITVYAVDGLAGNADSDAVDAESSHAENYTYTKFTTNLTGLIRFQTQSRNLTKKIGNEIAYIMLIIFTVRFTIIYLKRMLYIAFLTITSPLVAMAYPIDKMSDRKSRSFEIWIKEYVFNLILQPIHMLIYYVFIASVMGFASENILYVLVVYELITRVEKILKQVFTVDRIPEGVVSGVTDTSNNSENRITYSILNVKNTLGMVNREMTLENNNEVLKDEIEKGRNRLDLVRYVNINNEDRNNIEQSNLEKNLVGSTEDEKNVESSSINREFLNTNILTGTEQQENIDNVKNNLNVNTKRELSSYETIRHNNLLANGSSETELVSQITKEGNRYNNNLVINNNLKEIPKQIRYIDKSGMLFNLKEIVKKQYKNIKLNMNGKKIIKGIANNILNNIKIGKILKKYLNLLPESNYEKLSSSIENDRKYNPLEGIRFFMGMSVNIDNNKNKNNKKLEDDQDDQEELIMKEERIINFLKNNENLKAYQEKYGDLGEEKLSVEIARGVRLAEKGIVDINEQMQVAAYTDSMVDELFDSKFKNCTNEEIHNISEQIRENARKNNDKNLEKLADKDIIKVSLRNATIKNGTSIEELAIKTLKAKKEIGVSMINSSKEKQEMWINEISDGNKNIADGIKNAIEASKKMDIAISTEANRQNELREEYNNLDV